MQLAEPSSTTQKTSTLTASCSSVVALNSSPEFGHIERGTDFVVANKFNSFEYNNDIILIDITNTSNRESLSPLAIFLGR